MNQPNARTIKNKTDLMKFYNNLFNNEFLRYLKSDDLKPERHPNNHPDDFLKGKYLLFSTSSYIIISKVNGEFLITEYPGVWG